MIAVRVVISIAILTWVGMFGLCLVSVWINPSDPAEWAFLIIAVFMGAAVLPAAWFDWWRI
jgi:hypothetical protein